MTTMDVSVIIVNWKVKDLLRQCLKSLYARTKGVSFEVFVVDNASQDGSVEMVAKEFPEVQLIANNRNLGFAAANNTAIGMAQGDYVLLLNPDTELREDAVTGLVGYMRDNPGVAIAGPKLLNPDGTVQSSVRSFPTFCSQALIMLKLHHLLPGLGPLRRYFAKDLDHTKEAEVDQVMGAAFMVSRDALERIGLLDAGYFIWFEEVDLCRRAFDAGLKIAFVPSVAVVHHGGESFAQVFGPRKQRMFNASMRRYFRKHHGLFPWLALLILHPLSLLLAWAASLRK